MSRPVIDAVLFSLAIAIGITPQLLPAIVSVSLAAGSRELARRKVLVKRLVTIEDLGNIRLLFTDKTGTLTEGAITLRASRSTRPGVASPEPLALGLVCNEATLTADGPVGGNLLDQALWTAAGAAWPRQPADAYRRLGLLPFDHERQLVSVTARTPGRRRRCSSPRARPRRCSRRCVDVPDGGGVDARAPVRRGRARRGRRDTRGADDADAPRPEDERDLHLAGFLTFTDPPKADAGESIAKLAGAGHRGQDHHRRQRHRRGQGVPRHRARARAAC